MNTSHNICAFTTFVSRGFDYVDRILEEAHLILLGFFDELLVDRSDDHLVLLLHCLP